MEEIAKGLSVPPELPIPRSGTDMVGVRLFSKDEKPSQFENLPLCQLDNHDGCAGKPGRLGEPSFLWRLLFISTSYIILQLGGWFFEFVELSCVFGNANVRCVHMQL